MFFNKPLKWNICLCDDSFKATVESWRWDVLCWIFYSQKLLRTVTSYCSSRCYVCGKKTFRLISEKTCTLQWLFIILNMVGKKRKGPCSPETMNNYNRLNIICLNVTHTHMIFWAREGQSPTYSFSLYSLLIIFKICQKHQCFYSLKWQINGYNMLRCYFQITTFFFE